MPSSGDSKDKIVSAIIVCYNGLYKNWLSQCLDSLMQSDLPVQVIVVDNNSDDQSTTFVKSNYPDAILIESSVNLGFGGANNIGIKKALEIGSDYVFLLNQDARVQENTLSTLVGYSAENPKYGIISPIHLNGAGDKLDYKFSIQVSPPHCDGLFSDALLGNIQGKVYETMFVCAAAWLIPKDTLRIVGGFNPTFFHYGEDDNYCQRVKYFGLKVGVLPSAIIYHDREDRVVGGYHTELAMSKRAYLRKLSNPFEDFTTNYFKTWLKLQYHRLSKNNLQVDLYKYMLSLAKGVEQATIKENYLLSKSNRKFKFLDYKE